MFSLSRFLPRTNFRLFRYFCLFRILIPVFDPNPCGLDLLVAGGLVRGLLRRYCGLGSYLRLRRPEIGIGGGELFRDVTHFWTEGEDGALRGQDSLADRLQHFWPVLGAQSSGYRAIAIPSGINLLERLHRYKDQVGSAWRA